MKKRIVKKQSKRLSNEDWAWYCASIIQTLAHWGEYYTYWGEGDPTNPILTTEEHSVVKMAFDCVPHYTTTREQFINWDKLCSRNIKTFNKALNNDILNIRNIENRSGYDYLSSRICLPPRWMIADMKMFANQRKVPMWYINEIHGYLVD